MCPGVLGRRGLVVAGRVPAVDGNHLDAAARSAQAVLAVDQALASGVPPDVPPPMRERNQARSRSLRCATPLTVAATGGAVLVACVGVILTR